MIFKIELIDFFNHFIVKEISENSFGVFDLNITDTQEVAHFVSATEAIAHCLKKMGK